MYFLMLFGGNIILNYSVVYNVYLVLKMYIKSYFKRNIFVLCCIVFFRLIWIVNMYVVYVYEFLFIKFVFVCLLFVIFKIFLLYKCNG